MIKQSIKMRVTPEQSKKVQEICFENGIYWGREKELQYINEPFLFVDERISFMDIEQEMNFLEQLSEEVSAELFIRTNGTCVESETPTKFISTEEFDQMLQQKTTTNYMVFVEGKSTPKKVHDSYDSAEKEAKSLSAKEIDCNVMVLSVVKTFKSKVIVEEVK